MKCPICKKDCRRIDTKVEDEFVLRKYNCPTCVKKFYTKETYFKDVQTPENHKKGKYY
tara:strand:+ start:303 stop:476 length:174 start_codon:yes stop_codon:yes gene_type:complete